MLLITQPRAGVAHGEILALQTAARLAGWDVLSADTGWRLDASITRAGTKGVPYGSQTFCEVISQQMGWTLKANPFDWLAKLPNEYLKRQVDFMTLKEAKQLTERKFIKPADDKVFQAAVYEPGTLITHAIIPDDTPTLVSDVVEFDVEYRCFTDGEGVQTWSNYLFFGEINDHRYTHMIDDDHESPVDFVNALLQKVPTVPSVVDVGIIHGKGMAIVETNQAWASGLYKCDAGAVLSVLEKSAQ